MHKFFPSLLVLGLSCQAIYPQQPVIIDHTTTDLSKIPDEYITKAKQDLHIFYGHTSHGSQVTEGGMAALERHFGTKYAFGPDTQDGSELFIYEDNTEHDLSEDNWISPTVNYLDNHPECNVVMWAWCDIDVPAEFTQAYIDDMEDLMDQYPGVQFVFMTGHNDSHFTSDVVTNRKMILNHCIANNRILFDFSDIEAYDPDGNFFGDWDTQGNQLSRSDMHFLTEDISYDMDGGSTPKGNWGTEWMADNPNSILTELAQSDVCTSCAHSTGDGGRGYDSRLHCVLKGNAMWWLAARLAGWNGEATQTVQVTGITVTGAGGATTISTDNGTLQLNAAISPENATNKAIIWSMQNGTGQASIIPSGLVTAIADGTVTAMASATDGSGVKGSLELTLSGQSPEIILVDEIVISGEDQSTSISTPGGTLQLYATVLPENATNRAIIWSLQSGSEYASINPSGLLSAISDGTATAMASATDGSGTTGVLDITVTNQNAVTGISDPHAELPEIAIHGSGLTVRFKENANVTGVTLYDVMGKLLDKQAVTDKICLFDISGIPSGIYILIIHGSGKPTQLKFVNP